MIRLFKVNMSSAAVKAAADVLQSGWIAQGPKVDAFEAALDDRCYGPGGGRVVTVNSGTTALELAYALVKVRERKHVISTPMTCIATNLSFIHHDIDLEWADVDPLTGLIDVDDVVKKLRPKTKAVIGVDWGGALFNSNKIFNRGWDACGKQPIVIADSAHRLVDGGATYGGRTYVAWSFQAIKFLTAGDGGALWVPEGELNFAKRLRWFGFDRTTDEDFRSGQKLEIAGYKWHMNDVVAAIGLANLRIAEAAVEAARCNAAYYRQRFSSFIGREGNRLMALPPDGPDVDHHYWLFTILVAERDDFVVFMKRRGIEVSQVHTRNDRHPVFVRAFGIPKLPGLDFFSAHQVSIPVGFHVTAEDREVVANAVEDWAENAKR